MLYMSFLAGKTLEKFFGPRILGGSQRFPRSFQELILIYGLRILICQSIYVSETRLTQIIMIYLQFVFVILKSNNSRILGGVHVVHEIFSRQDFGKLFCPRILGISLEVSPKISEILPRNNFQ